jgi:hypothetical protein
MYTVRWAATAIARPCARGGRGTRAELTVRREADTQVGWLAAVRAPCKAETNNRNRQGPLSQAASASASARRRRRRRPTSTPASASASAGAPAYSIRCNTSTWAVQRQARAWALAGDGRPRSQALLAAQGLPLTLLRATFRCSVPSTTKVPSCTYPSHLRWRPRTCHGMPRSVNSVCSSSDCCELASFAASLVTCSS